MDQQTENWLFRQHSRQTVKVWLKQLRYFYFIRAWGGLAQDGDQFEVAFKFFSRQDLIHKLGQLGVTLNTIPEDFPKPVLGQPYPSIEFAKFKSEIKPYSDLEQPGHSVIFGHKAFVWVGEHAINISIAGTKDGNRYEISEDDFNVCLALEKHFDDLGWKDILDSSLDSSACCISRARYPELYETETTINASKKKRIIRSLIYSLLSFPLTGFIYGLSACTDCGNGVSGIGGRIFIGCVEAVLTTFTLGAPWNNEGGSTSTNLRPYVLINFVVLFILFYFIKKQKNRHP